MKLIYATDLHGDTDAYAHLAAVALQHEAQALVLGGDWFAYSPTAAPQLAFAAGPFRRFLERLATASIPVLAIAGNVDRPAAILRVEAFAQAGLLRLLRCEPYRLRLPSRPRDTLTVLGYPMVPPTPFRIKDHERRDRAADRYGGPWPILLTPPTAHAPVEAPAEYLDRLPSIEDDLATITMVDAPYVLVAHTPPYGVLDLNAQGQHVGSRALAAWIGQRQPVLSLHGHIHEAPEQAGTWTARLGTTVVVNPGPTTGTEPRIVTIDTATWSISR